MVDEPTIATETPKVDVQPVTEAAKVETPAPSVEAPQETAPVIKPEATLLGTETKTDSKPVDEKTANDNKENTPNKTTENKDITPTVNKPVEEKKTEVSQSDEPAPLPTYDAFKLPEGIEFDTERSGEFTKTLGEFEKATKADHAEVQKLGQVLIERHAGEVKKAIEQVNKIYQGNLTKQRNDWKEAFVKDPEIGGNQKDTTVSAAQEFIKTHGGTETQQKEFIDLMDSTGVGNHPAMIRILAKAMSNMQEGKSLPGTRPVPINQSKVLKRYGSL